MLFILKMRSVLILSALFLVSHAILNGRGDKWNSHGHLVKILARSAPSAPTQACSGTLISPRLVMTAADCVLSRGSVISEILVSIGRPTSPAIRKRASAVEVNGTVAYLALAHPIQNSEICPGGIPSGRIAHLSIVPSLVRPSVTPFEWDKIDMTTCRIVAFSSVENIDAFLSSTSVETAVVKVEVESDSLNLRRTHTNQSAPCYEDAGAPFECLVGDKFIQVGVLTSLFAAADNGEEHRFKRDDTAASTTASTPTAAPPTTTPMPTNAPEKKEEKDDAAITTVAPDATTTAAKQNEASKAVFTRCLTASAVRFARLDALSIAAVIEKHDFAGFVKMHEACRVQQ